MGSDLPSTPSAMGPAPAATALGVGFPFLSGFCFADTNSDQIQIRLLFRASSLVFPWSIFYLVIVERSLPVPVSPMGGIVPPKTMPPQQISPSPIPPMPTVPPPLWNDTKCQWWP